MNTENSIVALISEGVDRAKLGEAKAIYNAITAGNVPILRFGIAQDLPLGTPVEIRTLNGKIMQAALSNRRL